MVYFDKKYGWEKIKDIGLHTIGSVWTKDGKYYYFDDLGNNQLVKNTVFEINDKMWWMSCYQIQIKLV